MEHSSLLKGLLFAAAIAALITKIYSSRRRGGRAQKPPPGPKPWPVIGNLNLIGSLPHRSLQHLSQKYGDIMMLKFGKSPVVIASSPKMAEQFLRVHDAVFASRPALAAGKYISYDSSDVSFSPAGPYWRETRKLFMMELLSAKKVDSFEQIHNEERLHFLSRLRSLSGTAGKPVVLRDQLTRYTLSTISRIVLKEKYFGDEFEDDERSAVGKELQEMVDEWLLLSGALNIGDHIPWLGFLDLQGYVKRMKALRRRMDVFYDRVVRDHLARRAAGVDEHDFLDVLLQMADDPNAEVKITRDSIKALVTNLLIGGTDTAALAVEWALLELLQKPRVIEKAKEELDRVIGRNRWVEDTDFANLPYIDAIIMETLRLRPLGTLLAPRYSIKDCNVAGYDIPKGTTILINAWSIQRDPSLWDAAEEFVPERFLGKEVDYMTGSDFAFLPFGSGRRKCVGYNFGLKVVRATLSNLLHGFDLELPQGMSPRDIPTEEQYGLATHPKHPLSVVFKPTLPTHLY